MLKIKNKNIIFKRNKSRTYKNLPKLYKDKADGRKDNDKNKNKKKDINPNYGNLEVIFLSRFFCFKGNLITNTPFSKS
jgi:hypothetical protein